ncbi:hypothetical protein ACISRB_28820, partial [Micromonospora aurantiaca]
MQQRRTPGGQRPARRPGQPGRTGGARVRSTARDNGVRAEARAAGRSPAVEWSDEQLSLVEAVRDFCRRE